MNQISPHAARLLASVSRVTGMPLEVRHDDRERLILACSDTLTKEQGEFRSELQAFLRRESKNRAALERLDAELRAAREENEALARANRTLAEMATRDVLTGLYTRWFVRDKIDQELERSRRHVAPMSVLMVDVDHFKRVNDMHGHMVGDEVLREMGRLIRESLRAYDVPGRYGGEEFCLLLPATPVEKTLGVAERLRARIEENLLALPDDGTVRVTASIGVAGTDEESRLDRAEDLILLADQALYRAKNAGRNRVAVSGN